MLIDAGIPGSDDWYLMRLCDKLGDGLPRMKELQSFRDGDALIPLDMVAGEKPSYIRFLKRSRLHVVETLRDARTNRQKVIGFRTAAPGDEAGDVEAWRNWTASRMPVQSRQLFNDTADFGKTWILTFRDDQTGMPVYQVRNGWDTASIQVESRPWLTDAAVTYGYDPVAEAEVLTLYRPGYWRVAYRSAKIRSLPSDGTGWYAGANWTWISERQYIDWTAENLVTQNSTPDGFGIYEKHLDTVQRINEITLNALSIIVQQAFRQRAIEGSLPQFYQEGHPQAGQKIDYDELFKTGPAAMWVLGAGNTLKELSATDVGPVYQARKHEVEALASLTATPQYVFQGDSANQSGNGAELAREQLVFAVEAMNDNASMTFAQTQSLGFQMRGDTVRADATQIETMFGKVNPSTLLDRGQASANFKSGGATQRWIDENVLEMSPSEIRMAAQDRMTEAFTAAAVAGGTGDQSGSGTPNS